MTFRWTLLGLGLAFLLGCGRDEGRVEGCEDILAPDAWAENDPPRLIELWRAGGTNEGEELANPISAAVGPRGRLAIVDFQLGVVGVGADGAWLGPLTKPGSGPGEVGLPVAASWTDEGRTVVLDMGNGRLVATEPLEAGVDTTTGAATRSDIAIRHESGGCGPLSER